MCEIGGSTTGRLLTRSRLIPTIMSLGNRRHIPIAIKELMITLQTSKGLKKKQVANLLDVDARTVRRVTKLEAETGSVVREPVSKGPRRLLNGIDCAVCHVSSVCHDTYVLSGFSSISSHSWNELQTFICTSSRRTSLSAAAYTSHSAQFRGHSKKGVLRARS